VRRCVLFQQLLLAVAPFLFPLQFLNGDALREIFTHTEVVGSTYFTVLADVQLSLTILLFTYVVLNVTIALVEEAFFMTRTVDAQQLVRAARLSQIYIRQTVEQLLHAAQRRRQAMLT